MTLRSEIRNICTLVKDGAYGNPNTTGYYIYGKRPDRRAVPCNKRVLADGVVVIWSTWRSPQCGPNEVVECATEFTADEWRKIESAGHRYMQEIECNQILDGRKLKTV